MKVTIGALGKEISLEAAKKIDGQWFYGIYDAHGEAVKFIFYCIPSIFIQYSQNRVVWMQADDRSDAYQYVVSHHEEFCNISGSEYFRCWPIRELAFQVNDPDEFELKEEL